jgi:hypothetical protein
MSDKRRDPQREIARRAKRFANQSCSRCFGQGTMGRYIAPDGSTQIIICRCAYAGFPELKENHIEVPRGKRNVSPRS